MQLKCLQNFVKYDLVHNKVKTTARILVFMGIKLIPYEIFSALVEAPHRKSVSAGCARIYRLYIKFFDAQPNANA